MFHHITEDDYQPADTSIDIRTYREKVIDYLIEHSDKRYGRALSNPYLHSYAQYIAWRLARSDTETLKNTIQFELPAVCIWAPRRMNCRYLRRRSLYPAELRGLIHFYAFSGEP